MIVNSFAGIEIILFVPHAIRDHIIGEHALGVQDQQSNYIKFLGGQVDLTATYLNRLMFQTKCQFAVCNNR